MPKVAVTDYSFPTLEVEEQILAPLGVEIASWKEKRPAAELPQLVRDADYIITQFAPLTADVIATLERAKVIVRYGIGVDNVDLEAARAKNIPVCNIPDYCIDEVADQTLAFILAATRSVTANSNAVHGGTWGLPVPLEQMRTLRDLHVGVVGFGRIGREVVKRLLAFKCRVLVYDPMVPAEQIASAGCEARSLEELLSQSDVVTLHCPSTAKTRGLINADSIARMKPGVILVNVARGDLVDSAALTSALASGQISVAALDVFAPEPIPADHPILKMQNVILSAHIASASVKAVRTLRETAAQIVAKAIRGERLPNVVNGVG
ncbi:MAG TPA: C-terminal binding protein [Pirellulales bacterium]|jgi:D-3-phosphoglycerate dehydrogenase